MKTALLLIDLQNDFCPGGALGIQEGDATIAIANQAIEACRLRSEFVLASQDWHPANHRSFAVNSHAEIGSLGELDGLPQVWWPVHCVQDSYGAQLHPQLEQQQITTIFRKGEDPNVDSYSTFFDNGRRALFTLDNWLKSKDITHLTVMGLATDYCVKFTVLDALSLGYQTQVIIEGCRGVNINPEDSQKAFTEMQQAGAELITLSNFMQR